MKMQIKYLYSCREMSAFAIRSLQGVALEI